MLKYICYNWMPLIADHVMDLSEQFYASAQTSRLHHVDTFNPYLVMDNDLIFVKTDFIVDRSFASSFLDKIAHRRFNLITGISSYHIGRDDGGAYKYILEHPCLNKWICTNPPPEPHHKIVPIPIGFEEPDRPGGDQKFLDTVFQSRKSFEEKENKIFLPYHNLSTNADRRELVEFLKSLPYVVSQETEQTREEYYESMNEYKFVIGLEGRGPDIHRNYEAMLVGSIPINTKNIVEGICNFYGAHMEFVESWDHLNQEKFNELCETSYNIENNDRFLNLEKVISRVKKAIE